MDALNKISDNITQEILDSISDGVFTVNHDYKILTFNRAAEEITGYFRNEAIGKHCWEIFRSDICENGCALKKTLDERKSLTNRSTNITNRQGEIIPISASTSLLKDNTGKILGGVEIFRDKSIVEKLKSKLHGNLKFGGMISQSVAMKKIFSIFHQVAESDTTILIEGETGTGKELLSKAIHSHSFRRKNKFVPINCGALPDTLLESELFGYKAGAFTGATKNKPGLFASAGSGTVLLDEIGDTSPAFQIKLLRVLEEKEFQPLGSINTLKTDARIIAATNKDLKKMVEDKTFRQDLYYRINILHLKLPPLRKRTEDIPLLIEQFISKMNMIKDAHVTGITPDTLKILMSHDYPGNIRELENTIEHAFVLCREGSIEPEHLPPYLLQTPTKFIQKNSTVEIKSTLQSKVNETEQQIILEALKANNFNRNATARKLGMHKTTLYRKIKRLNIELPQIDGRFVLMGDPEIRS